MPDVLATTWLRKELEHSILEYSKEKNTKSAHRKSIRLLMLSELVLAPNATATLSASQQELVRTALDSFSDYLETLESDPRKKVEAVERRRTKVLLLGWYLNSCGMEEQHLEIAAE